MNQMLRIPNKTINNFMNFLVTTEESTTLHKPMKKPAETVNSSILFFQLIKYSYPLLLMIYDSDKLASKLLTATLQLIFPTNHKLICI